MRQGSSVDHVAACRLAIYRWALDVEIATDLDETYKLASPSWRAVAHNMLEILGANVGRYSGAWPLLQNSCASREVSAGLPPVGHGHDMGMPPGYLASRHSSLTKVWVHNLALGMNLVRLKTRLQ